MKTVKKLICSLSLTLHPEGGYFSETYRAAGKINRCALPRLFKGSRSFSTAIFFLLHNRDFSAFHRLHSDEMWHFYSGSSLVIHQLTQRGYQRIVLGPAASGEARFQCVIPAGAWFAAELLRPCGYALVGCTVAPGFDFADFEMASRANLTKRYPRHRALIARLTHS